MDRNHAEERTAVPQDQDKPNRLERRKARTRIALVRAAQRLLAEGRSSMSILDITQAADVGQGSFYNHFESREDLFQAAADDAMEMHGALLDQLTADLDDPAEVFACSFRLTGRLHRLEPELSKVLLSYGPALATADRGLAPRALRDIQAAARAGRFTVADPELALMIAAGAVIAMGQLLHDRPERDAAATADQMATDLLRMLGVDAAEAAEICSRPLPDLELRAAASGDVA